MTRVMEERTTAADEQYGVRVERNVLIPLPDGVRLAGDLYLPDAPGTYPVLVSYYPYHKDDLIGAHVRVPAPLLRRARLREPARRLPRDGRLRGSLHGHLRHRERGQGRGSGRRVGGEAGLVRRQRRRLGRLLRRAHVPRDRRAASASPQGDGAGLRLCRHLEVVRRARRLPELPRATMRGSPSCSRWTSRRRCSRTPRAAGCGSGRSSSIGSAAASSTRSRWQARHDLRRALARRAIDVETDRGARLLRGRLARHLPRGDAGGVRAAAGAEAAADGAVGAHAPDWSPYEPVDWLYEMKRWWDRWLKGEDEPRGARSRP